MFYFCSFDTIDFKTESYYLDYFLQLVSINASQPLTQDQTTDIIGLDFARSCVGAGVWCGGLVRDVGVCLWYKHGAITQMIESFTRSCVGINDTIMCVCVA